MASGARGRRPAGSQLTRRIHHEEKGRQLRPHRVARRRRSGRVHARSRRLRRSSSSDSTSGGEELQKLGKGEGQLNLISWAGYVEPEWVEAVRTGNRLQGQQQGPAAPPTKWSQLMGTGEYDGVSASGNASARLVAAGDVDPVNVDLVPNYETVFTDLKDQPYNTFEGVNYGIPHGRGANLLMWNSDDVKPGAGLLGRDARSEGRGQVQGQDQRLRRIRATSPTPPCTSSSTSPTWGSKTPTS